MAYSGVPTETQSLLSLADYLTLLERYRRWFVGGLLISMVVTFVVVKFVSLKFYKAESTFYINNRAYTSQLPGIPDVKIFESTTNSQFDTAVNSKLAESFLHSTELLTSATEYLRRGTGHYDLYALLNIHDEIPDKRRAILFRQLKNNLMSVKPIENTGLMEYTVELPDAAAAAQFANHSLKLLQREFMDLNFGYFAKVHDVYQTELTTTTQRQKDLADELVKFQQDHFHDTYESLEQERELLKQKLKEITERITELTQRVENLKLATSEKAQLSAQPIKVIDWAEIPLKKSRPLTILTTAIAGVFYAFIFLTCIMLLGMWRALRGPSNT